MQKQNYRILLKYSQLTLNNLTKPYYHVNQGCQFNYFELDQIIQNEIQRDESKQFKCPVCLKIGQLKLDIEFLIEESRNQQNQIVINMKDQQVFQSQKSNYFDSVLSQKQELFKLQQQFNEKLINSELNSDVISLKFIEKLNAQRNNEIFQLYRKCKIKNKPTLIGVINFKLILFYHTFKIKIELDLYDDTDKTKIIKLADIKQGQIQIKQISLNNDIIYLIVQQQNLYQLFRGDYNQLFNENKNEPIFYVQIMPNYTLCGESRLIEFQNNLIMIGSIQSSSQIIIDRASIMVEEGINMKERNDVKELKDRNDLKELQDRNDLQVMKDRNDFKEKNDMKERNFMREQEDLIEKRNVRDMFDLIQQSDEKEKSDEKVIFNDKIKIPFLNEDSQLQVLQNQSILLVGQLANSVGYIKEYNIQNQKIIEVQGNISKDICRIDFSFLNDQSYYLFSSEKLNQQRIQVTSISTTKDRNTFTKTMKIINHNNYMKVKIIPTTKPKVGLIICALVGLMFEQNETIFPGILVFNDQANIIEIELI